MEEFNYISIEKYFKYFIKMTQIVGKIYINLKRIYYLLKSACVEGCISISTKPKINNHTFHLVSLITRANFCQDDDIFYQVEH